MYAEKSMYTYIISVHTYVQRDGAHVHVKFDISKSTHACILNYMRQRLLNLRLGGSWVIISRVISTLNRVLCRVTLLVTLNLKISCRFPITSRDVEVHTLGAQIDGTA